MLPSERKRIALERGCDELMALIEWHYKHRQPQLKRFRAAYASLCIAFYRALERRFHALPKRRRKQK